MQIKGTPKKLKKYFKLMTKIEKNLMTLSNLGIDLSTEDNEKRMWKDPDGRVFYALNRNGNFQKLVVGIWKV